MGSGAHKEPYPKGGVPGALYQSVKGPQYEATNDLLLAFRSRMVTWLFIN